MIEAQLEALRVKVAAYEAPKRPIEIPVEKGVIQLGKKTDNGLVRVSAPAATVRVAESHASYAEAEE